MNIVIFGPPGSGKSTLAKKISFLLDIPNFDLDDVYWEKKYDVCLNCKQRDVLLQEILKNKDWIIEGVYTEWVESIVKESNLVIIINICKFHILFRLIKRFIKKKLSKESSGNLKSLFLLIRYACKYKNKNIKSNFYNHKDLAKKYSKKYVVIENKKDELKLLTKYKNKYLI